MMMQQQVQQQGQMLQEQQMQMQQAGQELQAEQQAAQQERMAIEQGKKDLATEKQLFQMQQKYTTDVQRLNEQLKAYQEKTAGEVEKFKAQGMQEVAGGIEGHMANMQGMQQAIQQLAQMMGEIRQQQAQELAAVAQGVTQTQQLLLAYATAKRRPEYNEMGDVVGVNIEGFTGEGRVQ